MQKLIGEGKSTAFTGLEKEIEQFTNEPKDKLMEIIDELGEDRIKSIPRGIGVYKKYENIGCSAFSQMREIITGDLNLKEKRML